MSAARNVPKMLRFRWTPKKSAAAVALAQGKARQQVAANLGIARMTLWRWATDMEFSAEVDRLTLAVEIATKAHRLRIAMRAVRELRGDDGALETRRDVLDWLKYAKSEMDAHEREQAGLMDARRQAAGAGHSSLVTRHPAGSPHQF